MSNDTHDLPLDWDEWRRQWRTWLNHHAAAFKPLHTLGIFPRDKNLLADDILGRWTVNGRDVELSEVRFGVRPEYQVRGIGVTFGPGDDGQRDAEMAWSFAELEQLLGIGGE